jgi:hypothetical protein
VRCAEEFPLLRQAERKYGDQGLVVLYIGHQDRVEKLTPYARDNRLRDYLYDPDDSVSRRFGMTYGGGVVFIDRDSVVKSRIPKGISASTVEAELKKIL